MTVLLNVTINSLHFHFRLILKLYYISLYSLDDLWPDSYLNSECNLQKKNQQENLGSRVILEVCCKQILNLNTSPIKDWGKRGN